MHALVLYILSPVPVSRRLAPVLLVPCPPGMRRLPLMVLVAGPVVMLETLMAELVVNVGCFPFNAAATSPTPVIVTLAAATDPTIRLLLLVISGCFPARVALT